jgi:hypothetical protein
MGKGHYYKNQNIENQKEHQKLSKKSQSIRTLKSVFLVHHYYNIRTLKSVFLVDHKYKKLTKITTTKIRKE